MVRVPGSCGEFVQGYWQGQPFLITCPIDWYTTVCIEDTMPQRIVCGEKAKQALEKTLAYLGKSSFPFTLTLSSQIPREKGMASSSADIGAVVIAVAAAFQTTLTPQEIAYIAASIEPTDGVFCPGLVMMNYRTGQCLHTYPTVPPMEVVIFDTGDTLNTAAYHRQFDDKERRYGAYAWHGCAHLKKNYTAADIGKAATYSAMLHQQVQYRADVPILLHIGRQYGSCGIVIGHSGTVMGLLFPKHAIHSGNIAALTACVQQHTHLQVIGTAAIISGGWQLEIEDTYATTI